MLNGESLNITQDNLDKLQTIFPNIFSEGKIDFEKFKAAFSDDINFNNERYVLNWAGKADAFKVLQIPSTATLKPIPEESINFDSTENVFIEGENLEVLKILQKSYYNKIKCIIIDPPYNTGNDSFIYPDSFKENKADYEKRIGDKDEEGYLMKEGLFRKNSKDSGHYHSNWLSMMYPRLFLAKNLLKDEGVIFVCIDDNEAHNLRLLMNEIFGEENFVANIIWEKKFAPSNDAKWFSDNHDHILVYSKNKELFRPNLIERNEEALNRYKNPDNDSRGVWVSGDMTVKTYNANYDYEIITPSGRSVFPPKGICWRFSKQKVAELISDKRVWFGENGDNVPRLKRFLSEVKSGITPLTIWYHKDVGHNQEAAQELRKLFEGELYFETPKPVRLIKKMVHIASKDNDIVLDFFGGSGTTAQAVSESNKGDNSNRKFILVQLPEQSDENSETFKANYKTIADISKERIRRVIQKIEKEKAEKQDMFDTGKLDLGFKSFKLSPSNFKIWRGNEITEENLVTQLDAFANPVKEESKASNMLFELMLKAGFLLTDNVEVKDMYYSIKEGELIIALDDINQNLIDTIIGARPEKVIMLDNLFTGNDQLKTNTALQMKDAGIDFRTI
jgi:adenine-specific DNA-methyltransferase